MRSHCSLAVSPHLTLLLTQVISPSHLLSPLQLPIHAEQLRDALDVDDPFGDSQWSTVRDLIPSLLARNDRMSCIPLNLIM